MSAAQVYRERSGCDRHSSVCYPCYQCDPWFLRRAIQVGHSGKCFCTINSMDVSATNYDPRYLAGIVLFNRHDFFEAHEVWEDLWMDTALPEKRFYQGLIQAAVGLCHFAN